MDDNDTNIKRHPWEGAETEYTVLRNEIVARINLRQQIMTGCLTLGGVLLAVGLNWPPVALIYPPLAAFLSFSWAQNDYRIRDISGYIKNNIEPLIPGVKWESHVRAQPRSLGSWRMVVIAHGGLFLFTQSLAIFLGVVWLFGNQPETAERITGWTLVAADLIAVAFVVYILVKAKR